MVWYEGLLALFVFIGLVQLFLVIVMTTYVFNLASFPSSFLLGLLFVLSFFFLGTEHILALGRLILPPFAFFFFAEDFFFLLYFYSFFLEDSICLYTFLNFCFFLFGPTSLLEIFLTSSVKPSSIFFGFLVGSIVYLLFLRSPRSGLDNNLVVNSLNLNRKPL